MRGFIVDTRQLPMLELLTTARKVLEAEMIRHPEIYPTATRPDGTVVFLTVSGDPGFQLGSLHYTAGDRNQLLNWQRRCGNGGKEDWTAIRSWCERLLAV